MTFLEQYFRPPAESRRPSRCCRKFTDETNSSPSPAANCSRWSSRRAHFLLARGLKKGDRCALLAPNSIRWVALDLGADGRRHRRRAALRAAGARRTGSHDEGLHALARLLPGRRTRRRNSKNCGRKRRKSHCSKAFSRTSRAAPTPPIHHEDSDTVTIIYTSGTSGEPKGVVLNAGKREPHAELHEFARLDQLMGARTAPERIFQYAPFCFAASWILLLTALSRNSVLSLSTDLSKLSDELKLAAPEYFLNVPTLLERVRARIQATDSRSAAAWLQQFSRARSELLSAATQEQPEFGRFFLARARQFADVSRDSQKHRPESEGADLRLGSAGGRNAAFLHDAGHSRPAGLRTHGNHRHLHAGRSRPRRARASSGRRFPAWK